MYYGNHIMRLGGSIWPIVALILSIVGGILVYVFFLCPKKELKLSPFLKLLKDILNFDKMIIEVVLKVIYLISTIYVILSAFNFIAYDFGMFFLTLVIGPILVRVLYELILIIICIWKNTSDINKKMK